jgi:drug/metabolite transporter (DMT)-like permease
MEEQSKKTPPATLGAFERTTGTPRGQSDILGILAGVLIGLAVLAPTDAFAYLDPGTGTFALQGLIAGIAGGVLGVRAYWRRIGGLLWRPKASGAAGSQQPLHHGDT